MELFHIYENFLEKRTKSVFRQNSTVSSFEVLFWSFLMFFCSFLMFGISEYLFLWKSCHLVRAVIYSNTLQSSQRPTFSHHQGRISDECLYSTKTGEVLGNPPPPPSRFIATHCNPANVRQYILHLLKDGSENGF